jgi:endonuclease-3
LESLPGVGRKTANVVLNVVYGEKTMPVDTHLLRISPRIGLSAGTTPLQVEQDLLERIPKEYLDNAHHWLILHGRYVCMARKPKCRECLISEICKHNGVSYAPGNF